MRSRTDDALNEDGATAVTADVVADAKRCLALCVDMDGENRTEALADLEFLSGKHWDPEAERQRSLDGRPCLTIDTLTATVNLVVNDARQNQQSIHVHAVGGGASQDTAEVMEGMCRHIEYDSNADAAYDTAITGAVQNGFGFFRLLTEYENEDSFNQKMVIKRVRNPFTVYIDPLSQEADGSDMQFAIISTRISKAEFRRLYPDAEMTTEGFDTGAGDNQWVWTDDVRLAEFYRIEYDAATLVLYSDGSTRYSDDKTPVAFGVTVVKRRPAQRRKVMWYKVSPHEVLEKTEVPFYWIPVFPVWGGELDIDGRIIRSGIVRAAKDPTRMYDYFMTAATEEIALRTKTPFIGAVGQFETAKSDWEAANNTSFSYLEYDPVTVDGTIVGAPQRQPMADIPAGNLQMCALARDNVKAATGIFDASLGARSNETSGRAINARQRQGDIANFHFADNLARAIRHLGRTMIKSFGKVYDTARVVRILNEDGTAATADINAPNTQGKPDKAGEIHEILNDLSRGQYDVVVSSGPSYSTLRQESAQTMLDLAKNWPELRMIAGPEIVSAMDFPGNTTVAAKLKKAMPAELRDDEDEGAQPMVQTPHGPMDIQQAGQLIAQSEQAFEAMNAHIDELESGLAKTKMEIESRERIAVMQTDNKSDIEELKAQLALALAGLKSVQAVDASIINAEHQSALKAQDAMHSAELAEQQAELTPAPAPGADQGAMGGGGPEA